MVRRALVGVLGGGAWALGVLACGPGGGCVPQVFAWEEVYAPEKRKNTQTHR